MIAKYCNGARIPPEHCAGVSPNDPIALAQCKGYNVPPGHSESTGLYPVFSIAAITPSATVDEGNNWINLTYGPLSLSNASKYTAPNTLLAPLGNYVIADASPAANAASCLGRTGPRLLRPSPAAGNAALTSARWKSPARAVAAVAAARRP